MAKGWEDIYKEEEHEEGYAKVAGMEKPLRYVIKFIKLLKQKKYKKVLDLGCGIGRHLIPLIKAGFEVYGFDISPTGIKIVKKKLKAEKLRADIKVGRMEKRLPYKDKFFDAIISTQTIHHNKLADIKKTVIEIKRVLKPKGLILITVPTSIKVRLKFIKQKFKKIEPSTYVLLSGFEAGVPHHYFSKKELKELFSSFKIINLHVDEVKHYSLLGEKVSH